MWRFFLCMLLFESLYAFNIRKGIRIRAAENLNNDELMKIDLYLRQYGYLIDHMPGTEILASREDRKYALQFFQNYNNLDITGVFDQETSDLFATERCGCPDVMPIKNDAEFSKKTNPPKPVQFNLGTKWENNRLTWKLSSFSQKIPTGALIAETRRAFDLWSKDANLQFTERTSGNVDIDIDFARREHGDGAGNAFDGPGRVLAHAFFPPFGDTHFDEDENWVVNRTGTDYFTVAAHEFGHALGLGHSEINQALMAPFYTGYQPNRGLHPDDVAGIRALYGAPISTVPTTPFTPPTTNSPPPPPRPEPTRPPTDDNRPVICDLRFNAVVKDFNGDYLAFIGRSYVMRINPGRGFVNIDRQRRLFRSSPLRPDAAFEVNAGSLIMMLKGRMLYQFDRTGRRVGRRFVRGGGAMMPQRPNAAITLSSNSATVIGYSMVWEMSPNTGEVVYASHRQFTSEYPGVPTDVDAAVVRDRNNILFFKDDMMYIFNRSQRRVTNSGNKGNLLMPETCTGI